MDILTTLKDSAPAKKTFKKVTRYAILNGLGKVEVYATYRLYERGEAQRLVRRAKRFLGMDLYTSPTRISVEA